MRRYGRPLYIGLAISLVLIFVISVQGALTFIHAKNLVNAMKRGDVVTSQKAAQSVGKDTALFIKLMSMPGIKQFANFSGLNVSSIDPEASAIVEASPFLAGVNKTQKYLMAFQNSAEARGTGGILGAYAIIEVKKGSIAITQSGSNAKLASLKEIPVQVPSEYLRLYGQNPAILQNSNLSPHFPYGAEIWMGLWKKQTGEQLDGVIALDPSALSYILNATGPIHVNNRVISENNVVSETLKDAYKRFENDNLARKQYLVDIINATTKKIETGHFSKVKMISGIRRAIVERRILFYSRDKEVQKILAPTKLSGYLSTRPNNEYRVVIQNIDASKLDFYLNRYVDIKTSVCAPVKKTTVTVDLTNTLKSGKGLPAYVLTRADKGKPESLISGAHRFKVFIYGPVGSTIVSAWREHLSQGIGGQSMERKRPVMVMDVDLSPTKSERLQVNFSGGIGKISYVDQPLVIPTQIKVAQDC